MEQLIAHIFGDYVLQSDWMARAKKTWLYVAFIHAIIYTVPFLLFFGPCWALVIICVTHALIDHYDPHKLWMRFYGVFQQGWIMKGIRLRQRDKWKTYCDERNYKYEDVTYPEESPPPDFLGVWGTIINDNAWHLLINWAALAYTDRLIAWLSAT